MTNEQEEWLKQASRRLAEDNGFYREIEVESDRGAVILTASRLDYILGEMLQRFLVPSKHSQTLFKGESAPLSSFSARIKMAYALGLISEPEYKNCDIIRKIRNDFAHKFELRFSFEDRRVKDLCGNFIALAPSSNEFKDNPRQMFIGQTVILMFIWRMHSRQQPHRTECPPMTWISGEDFAAAARAK
jgi:hypothetical protein